MLAMAESVTALILLALSLPLLVSSLISLSNFCSTSATRQNREREGENTRVRCRPSMQCNAASRELTSSDVMLLLACVCSRARSRSVRAKPRKQSCNGSPCLCNDQLRGVMYATSVQKSQPWQYSRGRRVVLQAVWNGRGHNNRRQSTGKRAYNRVQGSYMLEQADSEIALHSSIVYETDLKALHWSSVYPGGEQGCSTDMTASKQSSARYCTSSE